MQSHYYYVLEPIDIKHQTFMVTHGDKDYFATDVRRRIVNSVHSNEKEGEKKAKAVAAALTTTRSILHLITDKETRKEIKPQKVADLLFELERDRKELEERGKECEALLFGGKLYERIIKLEEEKQ